MGFVENLIIFLTMHKCENWFIFDKVITDYVISCFYGPSCSLFSSTANEKHRKRKKHNVNTDMHRCTGVATFNTIVLCANDSMMI